ncbi:chemotaxis protein CheW [Methylococcaceae bacterium WWC4]|uniref:chemotaxis protein CheW n=1 Tax=Methylomonas sp. CM2 TaxID=3417647 RepID=UPI0014399AB9|nr:chemotaxis protein CheW [Methylococcaceae bacterium WWC4]
MNDSNATDRNIEQFLTFELAGDAYALSILKVQEIRGWEPVRKLPDTPAFVVGALNLRGMIVPVVDLRIRFGIERAEYTPTTVVIVACVETAAHDQVVMGVIADAVSDVLDVDPADIKPAPNLGARIDTRYMRGIYVAKQHMVMVLNVDKLLDPEEFVGLGAAS